MPTSSEAAGASAAVILPAHLHARPAGKLVTTAAGFQADIEIVYGGKAVNARGVLAVLSLGATAGTTVVVRATGPDADDAVTALAAVLVEAE